MFESRFSISHNDEGHMILGVTPAAGEEVTVGRLVDYLTPTKQNDQLNPATPDDTTGEIRRTLAPELMRPQVATMLHEAGFTLDY